MKFSNIAEHTFKPTVSPSNDLIVSKLKRNQTRTQSTNSLEMNITDYLHDEQINKKLRREYAIESRLKEIDELARMPHRSPRSVTYINLA